MKILLVHMRYDPDPTGTAPLVTQLAQDLVKGGDQVTVITSLPHYGRSSIHPGYKTYRGFFHRSVEEGVMIIRTPVFLPRRGGLVQRGLNYLSYNIWSIGASWCAGKADIVLAVNPPITTTFAAWIISLLRSSSLVVGIQDVWPDCIIEIGQLRSKPLIWLSKFLEKLQYRIACKVIVLSEGMKKNLLMKSVGEEKIAVIANWADTERVVPGKRQNHFAEEHGLEDRFVVLFAGNHGYIAALENIILAAEKLKDETGMIFLLAGEGSVKKDLEELVEEKGLSNVKFLPSQPEKEWLEMLAASDLGLVTLRRDLAELNVPSKTYTIMAAGRPVLASVPENSEVAVLVTAADAGAVIPPEDPGALAEIILQLRSDPDRLEEMGRNGRQYLLGRFNRTIQTEKYRELLSSCLSEDKTFEKFD
jgi:colanic acid biosynthesis glycosyl transferase WcaI